MLNHCISSDCVVETNMLNILQKVLKMENHDHQRKLGSHADWPPIF